LGRRAALKASAMHELGTHEAGEDEASIHLSLGGVGNTEQQIELVIKAR